MLYPQMFDDYKKMIESVFGEGLCVKLFVRSVAMNLKFNIILR